LSVYCKAWSGIARILDTGAVVSCGSDVAAIDVVMIPMSDAPMPRTISTRPPTVLTLSTTEDQVTRAATTRSTYTQEHTRSTWMHATVITAHDAD